METTDLVERVARAAFAAHHHSGPTEEAYAEPNWGRGGFKTERVVWDAVAKAALEAAGVPLLTKELRDLATALHRQHYAHVTQWEPLDDPRGILSQIDNMTAGMRDAITTLQTRVEKLEGALRGIAFAVRHGAETDVQAWTNLANACQQTARAALAEDYCGIVEVNEEDFKAEGEGDERPLRSE